MAEYCLRWNNHQPNLVTVFSELLNAETLVDVTLATDGHFIHAHKLVLSACSVYFKDLFGSNPCKHPIVFLKDIKIEDLKTVIDFIYRGEVNVSQERLQDVLKTAESLRIKGLADKPFSYDEYPSQSRSGGQQHLSSSFSSQRSSLTDSREQQQSGDADDLIDVSGGDAHSPPAHKKRKVAASQDSSDGAQETNHEEDRHKSNGKEENAQPQKPPSAAPTVNDEGTTTTTTPKNSSGSSAKEKQKDEKEVTAIPVTSESRPEFQESRAADAMLMLQGSSSDGGEDGGGSGSGGNALSNTSRTGDSSNLMSSHSQGNLGWSLSLGHWWASFLPALAHHHHHSSASSSTSPSSLYGPPRAPRGQISPVAFCGLSGSSGVGGNTNNNSSGNSNSNNNSSSNRQPPDSGVGHTWGGNGSSSTSREGSPAGGTQLVVGSLDQLALVSALGKEISPQMVQALQAVASRRESFSSAAKLYSVSVTTLWRYYRKLGLSDSNPK